MKRSKSCIMLVLLAVTGTATAQDIVAFQNGYITFTNENFALYYRVESRPNLSGSEEWNAAHNEWINIKSNATTVCVPVGVFYRVVGSELPAPSTQIAKSGQTLSYRERDDGDVKSGATWPVERFRVLTNGTHEVVVDCLTGLMWKRTNMGDGYWDQAIDRCRTLDYAGYTDWRLPNIQELLSLVDRGQAEPALPSGHPFIEVGNLKYWSSTTYRNFSTKAWLLYSYDGCIESGVKADDFRRIWPVRGGQ